MGVRRDKASIQIQKRPNLLKNGEFVVEGGVKKLVRPPPLRKILKKISGPVYG